MTTFWSSIRGGLRGLFGVVPAIAGVCACSATSTDNALGARTSGSGGTGGWILDGSVGGQAAGGNGAGGDVFEGGVGGVDLTGDTACAESVLESELVPLDLFFSLDISTSMIGDKVEALRAGVDSFINDPRSEGLGATGRDFPQPSRWPCEDPTTGCTKESCEPEDYIEPALPWGTLPYDAFVTWVSELEPSLGLGFTPTLAALEGAVRACKNRITEEPAHKCAIVLVTDGRPESDCETAKAEQLGAVAAHALVNNILVFAVGFPGIEQDGVEVLQAIAQRGGTHEPYLIESGDMQESFTEALIDIRGEGLACEYVMPEAEKGTVHPDYVLVNYYAGEAGQPGGVPEAIPRVRLASDCGDSGGWYYDDNAHPTKLVLCPATCERVSGDAFAKIEILLGCTVNIR